jgi:hypothetical protein
VADTRLPFCSPYRLFMGLLPTPQPSAADRLHRAYGSFAWRSMGARHVAVVAVLSLLWPLIFLGMAASFTRRIGPTVAATTGKGVLRQLWEQFCLAATCSIPPDKYYVFELFRDERRAQANDYILRYELKGGLHNLMHLHAKQATGQSSKGDLKDKLSFTRRCRAAGVDAPIVLLYLDPNGNVVPEGQNDIGLPQSDIFIKPAKGKGGRGCEKWVYREGRYVGPEARAVTEIDLLKHIVGLANKRGRYLVQECLRNNAELRDLGDLTSLRITSCKTEDGDFEATNATLKLALGGSGVDNFHQGGAVAKVDMASGAVGPASDSWVKRPCVWHERHPITKAPIAGRILPYWRDTVRLVEKAHRLFPDRIMLGFDVAITDRGPVVIEGNVQSGCDMIQRTHDEPVGRQRLGQLLAHHAGSDRLTISGRGNGRGMEIGREQSPRPTPDND